MEARDVLTVAGTRTDLPTVLKTFREQGAAAAPVVVGAHRRSEAVFMSFALFALVSDELPREVLTVTEARKSLPTVLKTFREQGAAAAPVGVGSQRRGAPRATEGVFVSFQHYALIADAVDDILAAPELRERLLRTRAQGGPIPVTIEQLAAGLGIDAPGDETGENEAHG